MTGFSKELFQRTAAEFAPYCIDYDALKEQIHAIEATIQEDSSGVNSIYNKAEQFSRALDFNINRAVTFYEEKFAQNVHSLKAVYEKWQYLSPETMPQLYDQLKSVAEGLRECLKFVEINAEAVRKILDKAESHLLAPSESVKAASKPADSTQKQKTKTTRRLDSRTRKLISQNEFLISRLRPDRPTASRLESLRVYSGLDCVVEEIRHVTPAFAIDLRLDILRTIEAQWYRQGIVDEEYTNRVHARRNTLDLIVGLHSAVLSTVKKTKWYYGWLEKAKIDYEKEPIGEANTWGLILNNYNTFLYMANYYAVIPSANEYAQALGLSPATSGFLLAMTPLSALVSAFVYSLWSNRSFKQPLLFCTVLLVLGNYLYAVALHYNSALMLFLGRLFVGFGGNRAVNRRYIADYVSVEQRTFHSAVFVALGSLGMCLGPGSQTFFNMLNFKIPFLNYTVSPLTAPGWIMVLLWLFFALKVFLFFTEPKRQNSANVVSNPGLLQPLMDSVTSCPPDTRVNGYVAELGRSPTLESNRLLVRKGSFGEKFSAVVDTVGTAVCLWMYFVLKLVQEAFQTVAPLFAAYAFQWNDEEVGYLLAIIGFVVLPVNLLIGFLGRYIEDRTISFFALAFLTSGALLTVDWTADTPVSVHQYVLGALILFVSAQCLEAVCMALLSKVMPKSMSKGLWNSGFLSTEAGTFGRVVGSSLITFAGFGSGWIGRTGNIVELEALVMIPCAILAGCTLLLVILKWNKLLPIGDRLGRISRNEADDILKSELWSKNPKLRPICTDDVRTALHLAPPESSILATERRDRSHSDAQCSKLQGSKPGHSPYYSHRIESV